MSSNTVKGSKKLTSANSPANALSFFVEQSIWAGVNTAEVVAIDEAGQSGTEGPAGHASATPLVCPVDGFNRTLPPASIPKMPFYRPQAGKAAIVMDPQPGDKGVAVFMKRDSSGVATGKNAPVPPGSFRRFDQADGFLFNGFLGETPEIWLHLNPASGDISLSTKAANVEISCRESGNIEIRTGSGNVNVIGSGRVTLEAPQIVLDGNARVTGNLTVEGVSRGAAGPMRTRGGIENTGGAIISNAVSLDSHTHSGVEQGGGESQGPVGGGEVEDTPGPGEMGYNAVEI